MRLHTCGRTTAPTIEPWRHTPHDDTTATTIEIPGYRAGTWTIDPTHSEVGFSIRHLMISKVKGKFERFDATFVTAENPLDSTVTASAEVASITTNEPNRDAPPAHRRLLRRRDPPDDRLRLDRRARREGRLQGRRQPHHPRHHQAASPSTSTSAASAATPTATTRAAPRRRPSSTARTSVSPTTRRSRPAACCSASRSRSPSSCRPRSSRRSAARRHASEDGRFG